MQFYALFLARFVFGAFCRKRGEEGADYKGEGESISKGIHTQLYRYVQAVIVSVKQAEDDIPEYQPRKQAAKSADRVKAGNKRR